jgi:hypothetical protein
MKGAVMRKYIYGALAIAAVTIATTATPAYTSDTGNIAVSVTAQAPPAPCLTMAPGSVDFGTLPFTAPGPAVSFGQHDVALTNCGTTDEHVVAAGTNASGPSGTWQLIPSADICATGVNKYQLDIYGPVGGAGILTYLETTPKPLGRLVGGVFVTYSFPPSVVTNAVFQLAMPCQGSNGAGETKTLTATFTAVVA